MSDYYLTVDIGASSGRHILGYIENGKLILKEIHRFKNELIKKDGHLCWDLEHLFNEIKQGMKKCKEIKMVPISMGIDTWAIDYVLLDSNDHILGKTYSYRDKRTFGMDELVSQILSLEDLYQHTGIQKQIFNTIYQLMAVKTQEPRLMEKADSFLMLPDYFHFLLTNVKKTEYTNASTTQLLNASTKNWDRELIKKLGLKESIFGPISMPGTSVGFLTDTIANEVGFSCEVVLPATHDTGSAVMAIPSIKENNLYISSGTWSLMGTEQKEPITSPDSMKANLTNEGGYNFRFRYLKNIMGLWMIQSVKKELPNHYSFAKLCELASHETISTVVDCNDDSFLAPDSMIHAIRTYCIKHDLIVPDTAGELAAVIYNSLAKCYGDTILELEALTKTTYDKIHIVGGGSDASYLNELTARYTKKTVFAGPKEATAIGNLLAQMIKNNVFKNLMEARECVLHSFPIKQYQSGGYTL